MLVLNATEVNELLDPTGCIAAMDEALRCLAGGEVVLPLRPMVKPADGNSVLALMAVHRGGDHSVYGLKTVAVFPANAAAGLDPHQGTVTLFDGDTGETVAVMNATPITAIRTAAASALATRVLANPDASVLAVVGAGHQAAAHLRALPLVRKFGEIRVAGRDPAKVTMLAGATGARPCGSVEEAVRGADVVVLATSSPEPVIRHEWLARGAHVNAVGACFPHTRELDSATVAAAALFTDRRESCEREAGDYLIPLAEGVIGEGHILAELGDVLLGRHPGRRGRDELTVYESLGVAVEDLYAAEYVVRRAAETGLGTRLEF